MTPSKFSKDWKVTREMARDLGDAEYLPVSVSHNGEDFEVAKWSRFSKIYDNVKSGFYLSVPTADFGEGLAEMLDHTIKTGIGKLVTYRDSPRYVLDPGAYWRSYQASRFGVPRARYLEAIRGSRTVQRLLEKQSRLLRKESLSLTSRMEAFEETLKDMAIDYAAQEEEVRHLRGELARRGAE